MSKAVLKAIDDSMNEIGINYEYMEWTSPPVYPYFTGEYQEVENPNEDGKQETQFILNGFARGEDAFLALENAKEQIKEYLLDGRLVSTEKSVVAIFYSNTLANLPTGDAELKRIQINLTVKEMNGR